MRDEVRSSEGGRAWDGGSASGAHGDSTKGWGPGAMLRSALRTCRPCS